MYSIKLGMDNEAISFINSFKSSPDSLDIPGLSDLSADFVPTMDELRSMAAWAQKSSGHPLAEYYKSTIIPVCLTKIKSNEGKPSGPIIKMTDMGDNVQAIAAQMEAQMSMAMSGRQQPMQPLSQPPQHIPEMLMPEPEYIDSDIAPIVDRRVQLGNPVQLSGSPHSSAKEEAYEHISIPGMDNYVKGIERLISQEVRRRVKEEKKVFDLKLKEKDAIINRLNGELDKIKSAVKNIGIQ